MEDVLNKVNDQMLAYEQQEPLLDFQDMFEEMPVDIVVEGRKLIDSAFMLYWVPAKNRKNRTRGCNLVLFSDCLITIEEHKNKGHVVNYLTSVIPFRSCSVGENALPEETQQDFAHYFIVAHTKPNQSAE
uniref:Uncharacterized protein n=1 Tax=Vannella robusta TaxID=1487602 RepID=A0A7S4HSY0_9EUKA|mmetsp:Transcript_15200/g.19271  ORF Transcript_15200/g.19271 Transcript_15200/m.19271 type:complete len:130 (+) Transcript_15200:3-392(+)